MSVGELPLSPVSARDELQAHYNDLLALQDQADQVPLAKALDAVGLALSVLGHAQTPAASPIIKRLCEPEAGHTIHDVVANYRAIRRDALSISSTGGNSNG